MAYSCCAAPRAALWRERRPDSVRRTCRATRLRGLRLGREVGVKQPPLNLTRRRVPFGGEFEHGHGFLGEPPGIEQAEREPQQVSLIEKNIVRFGRHGGSKPINRLLRSPGDDGLDEFVVGDGRGCCRTVRDPHVRARENVVRVSRKKRHAPASGFERGEEVVSVSGDESVTGGSRRASRRPVARHLVPIFDERVAREVRSGSSPSNRSPITIRNERLRSKSNSLSKSPLADLGIEVSHSVPPTAYAARTDRNSATSEEGPTHEA